ncbi:MAG: prolipoprotein diacylglyceryl transferase [Candidatus Moraniibacteriota bacterium]
MSKFIEFYQYIPFQINPEIVWIGPFSFGWYAMMYLVAFLVVYFLLKKRLALGEGKLSKSQLFDFLIFCFIGVVVGARLGYVFFYNFFYYISNPLAIISPFDLSTGNLVGIYGMSYHGGLIGAIIFAIIFTRRNKLKFWDLIDFSVPAIPAGYFFGRLGNFLNGELYGRVTEKWWGMYFPDDELHLLRHPSQLYEAFLEGIVVFIFLWTIRNSKVFQGKLAAIYLCAYATARFFGEFYREPDSQIGFLFFGLTLGQIFSVIMFFSGLGIMFWKKIKKWYNVKR